ncbi:hypothetical protein HID58_041366 [Brassica napus]|uniref:Uncharacterized protein n=1 Tax=Brassica napus TaxID=3708 RepID=A0ABQ8BAM9_BRANA|nr:hypothetical protein HID58_041366 [Brassica napus]
MVHLFFSPAAAYMASM